MRAWRSRQRTLSRKLLQALLQLGSAESRPQLQQSEQLPLMLRWRAFRLRWKATRSRLPSWGYVSIWIDSAPACPECENRFLGAAVG